MFNNRIKKAFSHRSVLWDMAISQLKSKYAGSKLGIWWAVITPLILAASIDFVFTRAFKINIPNYVCFVLAGILPWLFFSSSLTETTNSFISNSAILKQGVFPREFVPLSCVMANLLNFLISLLIIIPVFASLNLRVLLMLPSLLLLIAIYFIFTAGLGILFAVLNVFFRDLAHLLAAIFMIWFWITPVFYSLDMLDFPFRWVCLLNPVTYFIISYQRILFNALMPQPSVLLASLLISIFSLLIGYIFFLTKESLLLKKI